MSLSFVAVFKLLQGMTHAPELWYILKANNCFFFVTFTASQLMFQYPVALILYIMQTLLLNVYPLVPLTSAHDFSWKWYCMQAILSVVWILGITTIFFFFPLGTGMVTKTLGIAWDATALTLKRHMLASITKAGIIFKVH